MDSRPLPITRHESTAQDKVRLLSILSQHTNYCVVAFSTTRRPACDLVATRFIDTAICEEGIEAAAVGTLKVQKVLGWIQACRDINPGSRKMSYISKKNTLLHDLELLEWRNSYISVSAL
jgi:hypothetical protein